MVVARDRHTQDDATTLSLCLFRDFGWGGGGVDSNEDIPRNICSAAWVEAAHLRPGSRIWKGGRCFDACMYGSCMSL